MDYLPILLMVFCTRKFRNYGKPQLLLFQYQTLCISRRPKRLE